MSSSSPSIIIFTSNLSRYFRLEIVGPLHPSPTISCLILPMHALTLSPWHCSKGQPLPLRFSAPSSEL